MENWKESARKLGGLAAVGFTERASGQGDSNGYTSATRGNLLRYPLHPLWFGARHRETSAVYLVLIVRWTV